MPFQVIIFFSEMRIEIAQWQAFDNEYVLSRHRIAYLETTLKSAFCVGDCALFEFNDVPSGFANPSEFAVTYRRAILAIARPIAATLH